MSRNPTAARPTPAAAHAPFVGASLPMLRAAARLHEALGGAQGVPAALAASLARAAAWVDGDGPRDELDVPIAWVDDLGLRRFDSPARALRDGLQELVTTGIADADHDDLELLADASEAMSPGDAARLLGTALGREDLPRLGRLLSVLVDDLGVWLDAAEVARGALDALEAGGVDVDLDVIATPLDGTSASAVTRCGNVLGVAGDARCLDAFSIVAARAISPVDRVLAHIRCCVAHVKRLGSAPAVVAAAFTAARRELPTVPDAGDRACLRALLGNLEALVHVRAGDRAAARTTVEAAWGLVSSVPPPAIAELGQQFLDEVRTQVLSNLAVVVGASDGWSEALPLLARGAEIASAAGPALQMECGALLGYALWRTGALDAAHAALSAADAAGARVPASTQRAQVWKLMAVIEDDRGNRDAAERWLARLG